MAVVPWKCPRCQCVVGVRNVGSDQPLCSDCQPGKIPYVPVKRRAMSQVIADLRMRIDRVLAPGVERRKSVK